MPQKRLVIGPLEIEHIEINCEGCHGSAIVPIKEPDPPDMDVLEKQICLYQCPWCGKNFDPKFQDDLTKLRKSLRSLGGNQSFTIGFVIQQGDGDT
jgi:hypothetical protein